MSINMIISDVSLRKVNYLYVPKVILLYKTVSFGNAWNGNTRCENNSDNKRHNCTMLNCCFITIHCVCVALSYVSHVSFLSHSCREITASQSNEQLFQMKYFSVEQQTAYFIWMSLSLSLRHTNILSIVIFLVCHRASEISPPPPSPPSSKSFEQRFLLSNLSTIQTWCHR